VLLAHSELSFPARTAPIKGDCPFVNLTAHFSALVWAPAVGMRLRTFLPSPLPLFQY
jgi:hypothetical protein